MLLAKTGTGFTRSWELSFDELEGGDGVSLSHDQNTFIGKVVVHGAKVDGYSSGGCRRRSVREVGNGRNEAHRKPSQVGDDQLL